MSCGSKYEDRKQKEGKTQVQWKAWSYTQYAGERQREREREKTHKTLLQKTLTQYSVLSYVCVQCTRFIQVLTRTDRSTIVLQCSLRAPTLTPKYIPCGISFFTSSRHPGSLHRTGVSDRYQPTQFSASPIGPNRFGPRLLQPIRPMLSLYLNKSVAQSTMDTEYMAVVEAGKEVIWMKNFIGELGIR